MPSPNWRWICIGRGATAATILGAGGFDLWALTHNPWIMLQTVAPQRLAGAMAEPAFRAGIDALERSRLERKRTPAWIQRQHPRPPLSCIAIRTSPKTTTTVAVQWVTYCRRSGTFPRSAPDR